MPLSKQQLQNGMLRAIQATWDSAEQDRDLVGITAETSAYVFPRVFCEQIASEFNTWMLGAALQSTDPVVNISGERALATAIRSYMFSGWGFGFATYMQTIQWPVSGKDYDQLAMPVSPVVDALTNAIVLQASLEASFMAHARKGGDDLKTLRSFADVIGALLYTYVTSCHVTVILKTKPPVPHPHKII